MWDKDMVECDDLRMGPFSISLVSLKGEQQKWVVMLFMDPQRGCCSIGFWRSWTLSSVLPSSFSGVVIFLEQIPSKLGLSQAHSKQPLRVGTRSRSGRCHPEFAFCGDAHPILQCGLFGLKETPEFFMMWHWQQKSFQRRLSLLCINGCPIFLCFSLLSFKTGSLTGITLRSISPAGLYFSYHFVVGINSLTLSIKKKKEEQRAEEIQEDGNIWGLREQKLYVGSSNSKCSLHLVKILR